MQVGDKVIVSIQNPEHFAAGCAEALNYHKGVIEQYKPDSINANKSPGPAFLVRFSAPLPTSWWNGQSPCEAFWFDPDNLSFLSH